MRKNSVQLLTCRPRDNHRPRSNSNARIDGFMRARISQVLVELGQDASEERIHSFHRVLQRLGYTLTPHVVTTRHGAARAAT